MSDFPAAYQGLSTTWITSYTASPCQIRFCISRALIPVAALPQIVYMGKKSPLMLLIWTQSDVLALSYAIWLWSFPKNLSNDRLCQLIISHTFQIQVYWALYKVYWIYDFTVLVRESAIFSGIVVVSARGKSAGGEKKESRREHWKVVNAAGENQLAG